MPNLRLYWVLLLLCSCWIVAREIWALNYCLFAYLWCRWTVLPFPRLYFRTEGCWSFLLHWLWTTLSPVLWWLVRLRRCSSSHWGTGRAPWSLSAAQVRGRWMGWGTSPLLKGRWTVHTSHLLGGSWIGALTNFTAICFWWFRPLPSFLPAGIWWIWTLTSFDSADVWWFWALAHFPAIIRGFFRVSSAFDLAWRWRRGSFSLIRMATGLFIGGFLSTTVAFWGKLLGMSATTASGSRLWRRRGRWAIPSVWWGTRLPIRATMFWWRWWWWRWWWARRVWCWWWWRGWLFPWHRGCWGSWWRLWWWTTFLGGFNITPGGQTLFLFSSNWWGANRTRTIAILFLSFSSIRTGGSGVAWFLLFYSPGWRRACWARGRTLSLVLLFLLLDRRPGHITRGLAHGPLPLGLTTPLWWWRAEMKIFTIIALNSITIDTLYTVSIRKISTIRFEKAFKEMLSTLKQYHNCSLKLKQNHLWQLNIQEVVPHNMLTYWGVLRTVTSILTLLFGEV